MKALFLILSLLSFNTFAKGGAGAHGGDVIICFKGRSETIASKARRLLRNGVNPFDQATLSQIRTIRLLDFWEYDVENKFNGNREDYIEDTLNKLDLSFFVFADRLKVIRDKKITFRNYSSLPILSDEGIVANVPQGCLITQIAIQKSTGVVLVDKNLFKLLSPFDQAGLYFHEYLYWHAIHGEVKHENSAYVRAFNSFLFKSEDYSRNELVEEIHYNLFDRIWFRNNHGSLYGKQVKIKKAKLGNNFLHYFRQFDAEDFLSIPYGTREQNFILNDLKVGNLFKVQRRDRFRQIQLKGDSVYSFLLSSEREVRVGTTTYQLPKGARVNYNVKTGRLILIKFPKSFTIGQIKAKSILSFYDDGTVKKVTLAENYAHQNYILQPFSKVQLDKKGRVEKVLDTKHNKNRLGNILLKGSDVGVLFQNGNGLCYSPEFDGMILKSCHYNSEDLYYIRSLDQKREIFFGSIELKRDYISFKDRVKVHFNNGKAEKMTFPKELFLKRVGKKYRKKREVMKDLCRTGLIKVIGNRLVCSKN